MSDSRAFTSADVLRQLAEEKTQAKPKRGAYTGNGLMGPQQGHASTKVVSYKSRKNSHVVDLNVSHSAFGFDDVAGDWLYLSASPARYRFARLPIHVVNKPTKDALVVLVPGHQLMSRLANDIDDHSETFREIDITTDVKVIG